jgi:hypothetical protein
MPWYYAGPEAKPVGPVSAEQLQALCAGGTITPETFVIEHTGPGAANLAWRRYREVFPGTPTLPPIPGHPTTLPPFAPAPVYPAAGYPATATPPAPVAPAPGTIPAPNPSAPGQVPTHPLFPSAVPPGSAAAYPQPVMPGAYPPIRPTNSWCAWGFALSLIGFCFAWCCGIGILPALAAVVLCIIGLVQVNKNRHEGGLGLAVSGLIFSGVAVLISVAIIAWFFPSMLKAHGLTVTEQTSNDSE